jgi:hypothetical protein
VFSSYGYSGCVFARKAAADKDENTAGLVKSRGVRDVRR